MPLGARCLAVVHADGDGVVVSSASAEVQGESLQLSDEVRYDFIKGDGESRIAFGYLILDVASGELDVFVEELWEDGRRLLHDWTYDPDHVCLALLFQVRTSQLSEPVVVIWTTKEEA